LTLPSIESLEQIDQYQLLVPPKNHVGLRMGLVCTLFAENPSSPEVRAALATCGDEYQQTVQGKLQSYFAPSGVYKAIKYPAEGVSLLNYIQTEDNPEKTFSPFFFGDPNYRVASAYGLSIMAPGRNSPISNKPAYITAVLPFAWLQDHAGGLQKLMKSWVTRLKPFYGYAGIGAVQSLEMVEKKRTRHFLAPLVNRHPGLEVVNPAVVSNHILSPEGIPKIKGANWMTAIGDKCLEPIGGQSALLAGLDENFTREAYEGGVLIQAGQMPQLGDRNTQHLPRYYKQLSDLLKPIRMQFPEGHSLLLGAEGESNTEATNNWLARFDDSD